MSNLTKKQHHTINCDLSTEASSSSSIGRQQTEPVCFATNVATASKQTTPYLPSSSSSSAAAVASSQQLNRDPVANPKTFDRTMEWLKSNSKFMANDGRLPINDGPTKPNDSQLSAKPVESIDGLVGGDFIRPLNPKQPQQPLDPTDQTQRLSKLTLSSSLHKLSDSKYLNSTGHRPKQQQQQHLKSQTDAPSDDNTRKSKPIANSDTQTTNSNSLNIHHHNNDTSNQPSPSPHQTSRSASPQNNNATNIIKSPNNNNNNNNAQRDANLDTVHVVVGNEACDLDSTVSCLLMFHIISKMSDEINGKDKTRTLYIPLLNTTRDMLDSKGEVLWYLEKTLNIDKSFLTCKDDIEWSQIKKNNVEILITLVDHNYNEEFNAIGRVVEIIDHHQVENSKWLMDNHSNMRLTIDTSVGSCSTLVAERLFYIYAEHHVSDEILLLIYGTVLLDTVCLSEKAKRFTRRDVYLLKKLDSLLGNKKPVRDQLYKQLVEVKNSTSPGDLNFEKLMRRDLKVYKDKNGLRIGIASLFGMEAKEALGLAANIDLEEFFIKNNYEAFVIMGLIADLDHSDSISRDLVLISADGRLFDDLCEAFEQDTSKLDLLRVNPSSSADPEDDHFIQNSRRVVDNIGKPQQAQQEALKIDASVNYRARIWVQRNVTSSRKVVAPLVLKVLHDGADHV